MGRYWFYDWLDERGITTIEAFERALLDAPTKSALRARAEEALSHEERSFPPSHSILAGAGLDLSGNMGCRHFECRVDQVNDLFQRAWLYFDRIVVADEIAAEITAHEEDGDLPRERLSHSARVAFYIRDAGADELIEFCAKPHYCERHGREALDLAGAGGLVSEVADYAAKLVPELEIGEWGAGVWYVTHPLMDGTSFPLPVDRFPGSARHRVERAAKFLARAAIGELIADVAIAHRLALPLGTAHPMHIDLLSPNASLAARVGNVAFNLSLPVLNGLPIRTLINIRQSESEQFERFRDGLRKAIAERIRLNPGAPDVEISEEIRQDLIEPELRRIRERLRLADEARYQKTGKALGVGAVLTTCGLLTGMIPAALLGVTTIVGGLVVPDQQYVDRRTEIELSDMYFLWHVTNEW